MNSAVFDSKQIAVHLLSLALFNVVIKVLVSVAQAVGGVVSVLVSQVVRRRSSH